MKYEELKVGDVILYDKELVQLVTSKNGNGYYNFKLLFTVNTTAWKNIDKNYEGPFVFVESLTKLMNNKIIKILYG